MRRRVRPMIRSPLALRRAATACQMSSTAAIERWRLLVKECGDRCREARRHQSGDPFTVAVGACRHPIRRSDHDRAEAPRTNLPEDEDSPKNPLEDTFGDLRAALGVLRGDARLKRTRSARGVPWYRKRKPCVFQRSAASELKAALRSSGVVRFRTCDNGVHRRRPPLAAALRRRYPVRVEPARDLAERRPARPLAADPSEDVRRKSGSATRTRTPPLRLRFLSPLAEVALKLGDRDQARSPLRPHARDCRDDAAVERRQADAERLRRLPARVHELLDPVRELNLRDGDACVRLVPVSALLRALPSLPALTHFIQRTSIVTRSASMMHLCPACYRGW
jgi:hypothetical protein